MEREMVDAARMRSDYSAEQNRQYELGQENLALQRQRQEMRDLALYMQQQQRTTAQMRRPHMPNATLSGPAPGPYDYYTPLGRPGPREPTQNSPYRSPPPRPETSELGGRQVRPQDQQQRGPYELGGDPVHEADSTPLHELSTHQRYGPPY